MSYTLERTLRVTPFQPLEKHLDARKPPHNSHRNAMMKKRNKFNLTNFGFQNVRHAQQTVFYGLFGKKVLNQKVDCFMATQALGLQNDYNCNLNSKCPGLSRQNGRNPLKRLSQ